MKRSGPPAWGLGRTEKEIAVSGIEPGLSSQYTIATLAELLIPSLTMKISK
jgi:hypothetical protein